MYAAGCGLGPYSCSLLLNMVEQYSNRRECDYTISKHNTYTRTKQVFGIGTEIIFLRVACVWGSLYCS